MDRFDLQEFILVTQQKATQQHGKGRVAMHDWILIAIAETAEDWLMNLLRNIDNRNTRDHCYKIFKSNVQHVMEHLDLDTLAELQTQETKEGIRREALIMIKEHRDSSNRVQDHKRQWREDTRMITALEAAEMEHVRSL